MKITFKSLTLALVAMTVLFASCNSPQPKPPKQEPGKKNEVTDADIKKIEFLDVSDYAKWVFYSFNDGKVKTVEYDLKTAKLKEDPSKDNSWDIAFHRWDVMTRDGAFKSDIKDLKKAYEVKLGKFTKDVEDEVTIVFGHMGSGESKMAKATINPILSGGLDKKEGWCILTGMPPVPTVSENIWFVKTADGKTVALNFKGAKKKDGKNGAVTLDYVILK